jgi:predicted HicB family RNase H-like nuclease
MVLKAKTNRRSTELKEQVIEEVAREETTRLNAMIPVSLHKQVKLQAVEEGRSITDMVIEALEEYLIKNSKE